MTNNLRLPREILILRRAVRLDVGQVHGSGDLELLGGGS
jgi:hypothetical protein